MSNLLPSALLLAFLVCPAAASADTPTGSDFPETAQSGSMEVDGEASSPAEEELLEALGLPTPEDRALDCTYEQDYECWVYCRGHCEYPYMDPEPRCICPFGYPDPKPRSSPL